MSEGFSRIFVKQPKRNRQSSHEEGTREEIQDKRAKRRREESEGEGTRKQRVREVKREVKVAKGDKRTKGRVQGSKKEGR